MIDLTRSFTATSEFVVAPVVDPLPPIEPPRSDDLGDNAGSRSVGAHGADDQSTREYRTGDDLRKIHWRSSARTGALMVRQEERPWQGQTTVLLDPRGRAHASGADGAERRSAADAAASSGRSARSPASARHVLLAGPQAQPRRPTRPPATGCASATPTRLTSHLAEVARGRPHATSTQAAEIMRAAARDSTLIAVLGRLDPKALRALADAHARGRSAPAFALLLDVDSWAAPPDARRRRAGRRANSTRAAEVLRRRRLAGDDRAPRRRDRPGLAAAAGRLRRPACGPRWAPDDRDATPPAATRTRPLGPRPAAAPDRTHAARRRDREHDPSATRRTLLALLASALGRDAAQEPAQRQRLARRRLAVDADRRSARPRCCGRRRPPGALDIWPGIAAARPVADAPLPARRTPSPGSSRPRGTWHDLLGADGQPAPHDPRRVGAGAQHGRGPARAVRAARACWPRSST